MTDQPTWGRTARARIIVPDRKPGKCPRCLRWFITGNTRCAVAHGPGQCCHHGDTEVAIPPGNIGDPAAFTAWMTAAIGEDLRVMRLMAGVEPGGSEKAGLITGKIESLEARKAFLERHQPDATGNCASDAAPWPCDGICDLSAWAEYPG